jgi:hypothetical protein
MLNRESRTKAGRKSKENEMIRRASVILATFALVVTGLAPAALADEWSRPFKGTVVGEVSFAPDASCPNFGGLRTDSDAVGIISHLGRSRMASHHCTPAGPAITDGEMTLIAADGDRVFMTYAGTAPFPGPGTEVIVATMEFEIVGGTGRFTDASGGGDMTGYIVFAGFDVMVWPASWVWEGTIGY